MPHPFEAEVLAAARVDDARLHDEVSRRFPPQSTGANVDPESLRRCLQLLDLTSLRGDEHPREVEALCRRAADPIVGAGLRTAAVCVFPEHVETARRSLAGADVRVAGACFGPEPGTGAVEDRLVDIARSLEAGADELDVAVTIALAASGRWEALYDEICRFREAAGSAILKVILGTGSLPTLTAVARASRVALAAGADFIKTSTGKEPVNATLPAGLVMAHTLTEHAARTGERRGLKPAGGIRTAAAATDWLRLAEAELGVDWVTRERFRIGASGLLHDLVRRLDQGEHP